MAFSVHINVMVFAGAVSSVVRIQTSVAIWGWKIGIYDAFHICNEHFEVISTVPFAYRGCYTRWWVCQRLKGCGWCYRIDCLLLGRPKTWVVERSTTMTAPFVMPKYLVSDVIAGWVVAMGNTLEWESHVKWWFVMIYLEWAHQSVVKTVCFQLRHEYCIGICRNVGYHMVKLVNVA